MSCLKWKTKINLSSLRLILCFSLLVGHAHTFSSAIERAKQAEGDLVLRIEDIDIQRCKPQYLKDMVEDMEWFQLSWNKGYHRTSPDSIDSQASSSTSQSSESETETKKIKFSNLDDEFVQSKRFPLYERAWKVLYDRGYLYPCPLSRKDVDQALSAPHDDVSSKNPPIPPSLMSSTGASVSNEKINAVMIGEEIVFPPRLRPEYLDSPGSLPPPACFPQQYQGLSSPIGSKINWRFRIPPKDWKQAEGDSSSSDHFLVKFIDRLCGEQNFYAGYHFGDFVIWRADGIPSYELAVTVDDILMGVSVFLFLSLRFSHFLHPSSRSLKLSAELTSY